ncbi:sugar phosphate isomerase/epimerase [Lacibacter cauensis]|uniref:Sugar phosphate isomerase/epimerase n=1 Tax=Lacibacter cauensis TaxID=510947 RepID=A0A562SV16_9BACT|nr:sugar phosphate isomerase/epimerase family protein [Lacibacter cauensis]TWI85159.1 sugar phosphate isomerase/epimerase [Lacibacter cauensis]
MKWINNNVTGNTNTMNLLLRRTLVRIVRYSSTHPNPSQEGITTRSPRYSTMLCCNKAVQQDRAVHQSSPFRGLGGLLLCAFVFLWFNSSAQLNTDQQYAKPLKEVLTDIQKKYGITIKYVDSMVNNKMVTYAEWKYRPDVEVTLDNILKPLELKVKKEKDKQYKLSAYEYYRWPVEEGWAEMDRIAAQYKTVEEWEKRKAELKPCLKEALQLNHLPAAPNSKPIVTPKRLFDGYSVENVAIEILPGVWINGSLYKPLKFKGKIPVILNPDGHWEKQRYRADCQLRCAAMAKMGAMAFSYDLFAWGESLLQFKVEDHRRSLAMTIQALGAIRILDYLLAQKDADTNRVGITGGSGGGSHTVLMTALDDRIKVSAPVVSLSSYFYGGCPCESGMNIHACGGRTNNVEIAAMAAPRPQLIVSDGGDWTDKMPEHDFPYLQTMYSWYNKKENVTNVHLPQDKHDFGITKRKPVYVFMAKQLGLNIKAIQDANGNIDESKITIEPEKSLYVFGENGEKLPAHAVKGFENLERVFAEEIEKARTNQRYKIGLIDLMLLKRQKLGAITLTAELKADGVEVDMGGLGNRPTFDNQLLIDSVRNHFIKTAKEKKVEIFCLAMTGYYAQSFCGRAEYIRSIEDCIKTMQLMNVKHAFLPLGVQCDIKKNPAIRDSVIARLKIAGKLAEEAGVIIGIETSLTAKEEVELLKQIGSPAIKIYFNFSNPLKEGRDLISELKILGKDRISMIHATNKDSVWLENDPQIDLYKVKKALDEIGWSGWLVIERSRDARKPSDTKYNYGANTTYLKKVFQGE